MAYVVCVEEMEDQWIAHVPDLPGCFTTHKERDKAVQAVPKALDDFIAWCHGHGLRIKGLTEPMVVTEVIRSWEFEDGHMVNAFFASDRPSIHEQEMDEYEVLLKATMEDLFAVVDGMRASDLMEEIPSERWPIAGILKHVARADWWYLDRLGVAFSRAELPEDAFDCLYKVGDYFLATLPQLCQRTGVTTMAGETWSARKVLRRCLWHRRDHSDHIRRLRMRFR